MRARIPTEQFISDHKSGATIYEIAEMYGYTPQNIQQRMVLAGYRPNHKKKSKKEPKICPTCKQTFIPKTEEQVCCQLACRRLENKKQCKKGHILDSNNIIRSNTPGTGSRCRICRDQYAQEYYQNKKRQ